MTEPSNAYQDFVTMIGKTDAMQQFRKTMDEEPAKLLGKICKEYEKTNTPVPDHHIHLPSYIGDVAIKALISAKLLTLSDGGRISLYQYEPTEEGLTYYRALKLAGFYNKK